MPDNPYDQIPYFTAPQNDTHPDRLATVGVLLGMQPAPVTKCRVLEIGCGDGSNLVPMAYHLPESRFTGVDLAPGAIAKGQQIVADLDLGNLTLVAADLRDIGPDYGEFDYIIAHGLYSWVPAEIRDALLQVCAARLAPQGIAFISYNAYPGRHMRQMLSEMMRYQTRHLGDQESKVPAARAFLESLKEQRLAPPAWRALLQEEIDTLVAKRASALWHDDLSPVYAPLYFHQFVEHAVRHGLQFLGDAETHLMSDLRPVPDAPEGDVLEREQMLDFLLCRRFRETLLCRSGVPLDHDTGPQHMDRFLFAAPCRVEENGRMEGLHGVRIAPGQPALERVANALGDSYPLPLPFEELVPYAGNRGDLREILLALIASGFASFHVHDFPCEEMVTERPLASRLARYQAARSPLVSSVTHANVQLDEPTRRLVAMLDGTRDVETIAREFAIALNAPLDEVRRHVQASLAWMARMGLLEPAA